LPTLYQILYLYYLVFHKEVSWARYYFNVCKWLNDLPATASSSNSFLFADNTKLLKVIFIPSDILLLQKDLDSFSNWSLVNKLYFGIPKRVFLSFNNKLPTSYHIDSNVVSHLSEHRDLGIQISSDFSWSNHYNMICSKAYRSL